MYHPSKRAEWTEKRGKDCRYNFRRDAKRKFPPVLAALNSSNMTGENQDYLGRSSDEPKSCDCEVKGIAVTLVKVKSISLAVEDSKRAVEDSGYGPMAKYLQVVDEAEKLKSTENDLKE